MDALRKLVSITGIGLIVLGVVLLVSGPATLPAEVQAEEIRAEAIRSEVLEKFVETESPSSAREACKRGYVHYWGEEYGYEVYLGDNFIFDSIPGFPLIENAQGCAVWYGYDEDVDYMTWEILGDVGEPNPCSGDFWECGVYGSVYVTEGCDDDASFYVWFFDGLELLDFYELDITYQYDTCSGS